MIKCKKISQSIRPAYRKCLHYWYLRKDEQSTVNVFWYPYLHGKSPPIVSHLITRSPLSLKARKYQVALKLEHPCSNMHYWVPPQPLILAPDSTHQQSQHFVLLRRIYETHLGDLFETNSRIFKNCNQLFFKNCSTGTVLRGWWPSCSSAWK